MKESESPSLTSPQAALINSWKIFPIFRQVTSLPFTFSHIPLEAFNVPKMAFSDIKWAELCKDVKNLVSKDIGEDAWALVLVSGR